jgi:Copper chaperone
MEKLVLRIEGMACGHCEIAVQDAVRKLAGIKEVKASKGKKEATIDYEASLVTTQQIKDAITNIGYDVID